MVKNYDISGVTVMKINFGDKTWQDQLSWANTYRYAESPRLSQLDDCIKGDVNKEHPEGFDNAAVMCKDKFSGEAHAALTCSFEGCGCPEVIIVPQPETDENGILRYGACYEIVLYKDGVNVWRHFRDDGKCHWHKHLGVLFPVEEKIKHTLDVTVKDKYITVNVDKMKLSVRCDDMFDSFQLGFAACEGVVRLYNGEIGREVPAKADRELELMGDFFDKRMEGYDEHMLRNIELSEHFYPYTASLLPTFDGANVLDLGCGTGLELEEYFKLNPKAKVTGIDLAPGMLKRLHEKLASFDVTTVNGSYFDVPFGEGVFDAAVSVESLHHFTKAAKVELYKKLRAALKDGGYFILTDYLIESDEDEAANFAEYNRLRGLQGKHDGQFYHFDTPLTVEHECEALREAGFGSVEVLRTFGHTCTLKACK